MENKIFFILKLIRIGLSSPLRFIKNINKKNIYTLKHALADEEEIVIEKNLKALISPDEYNKELDNVTSIPVPAPADEIKNLTSSSTRELPAPPPVEEKAKPEKTITNAISEVFTLSKRNKKPDMSNEVKYLKNHTYTLQKIENVGRSRPIQSSMSKKHVVMIADLNLPQCKKYRVLQKVEILKKVGAECTFSHWQDIPRCLNLLQNATSVIFYRIPDTDVTSCYLDEAIRLKINIGYDIDDPIFDKEIYSANKNIDMLTSSERANLLAETVNYQSFIRKCNFIVTSTPGMVRAISNHTIRPVLLWRNLVDSETINAFSYSKSVYFPEPKKEKEFVISYMSGSRAHEADFREVLESIRKVLGEFSYVKLKIAGYAEYGQKLKKEFPKQVTLSPFADYYTYLSGYQDIDLNIIPLVCDEFNDCKSAIRMMEASLFEVPSMVSYIGDFINIIEDRKDGILIKETEDWYDELVYYIKNSKELSKIGKNAKINVEKNLFVDSFCADFPREIVNHL